MSTTRPAPFLDGTHRHTTRCFWDLHRAGWQCPHRPTRVAVVPAPRLRRPAPVLGAVGSEDGC